MVPLSTFDLRLPQDVQPNASIHIPKGKLVPTVAPGGVCVLPVVMEICVKIHPRQEVYRLACYGLSQNPRGSGRVGSGWVESVRVRRFSKSQESGRVGSDVGSSFFRGSGPPTTRPDRTGPDLTRPDPTRGIWPNPWIGSGHGGSGQEV